MRRLLGNMGFFELLRVENPIGEANNNTDTRYVQFRTGRLVEGEAIEKLRKDDLEPVVGEVPSKRHLYAAVTEAMTNVVHHAYGDQKILPNWWLSASYNVTDGEVVIMLFDQGVGIPETLPRKFSEQIRGIARTNHAQIIKAAHELSRSSSEQKNRGNGLGTDVREYLNKLNCRGSYRVTSLQGRYIFEKQVNGETDERLENHKRALDGTLIEWRLHLQ